jgi:hypothetical protein
LLKSFKTFIAEQVPVVTIDTTGTDVTIPEIKNELNKNIDLILRQQYQSVEEAANKVRKILSMYNLDLPQIDCDDTKQGSLKMTVGYQHKVYDEIKGELQPVVPLIFAFNYQLINGLYKVSGELL